MVGGEHYAAEEGRQGQRERRKSAGVGANSEAVLRRVSEQMPNSIEKSVGIKTNKCLQE